MTRLVVIAVLLGLSFSVDARTCDPNEGTEPLPCDPNVCTPPECACETTEPEVPLADRPQVIMHSRMFGSIYITRFHTNVEKN